MKKQLLLTLLLTMLACSNSFAQAPIYDSTMVYDTVTAADTFYLFTRPIPCFNPVKYNCIPGRVTVQEYMVSDTVTVYGVAIPLRNYYRDYPIDPTNSSYNTSYRAVLMNRLGPSPTHSHAYSMELVDSVSLKRAQPRFCWFRYEDPCDKNDTLVVSCYEFYFDTPQQINRMMDTFYVGRFREGAGTTEFSPEEFGGEYSNSLPGTIYQSFDYEGMFIDRFFQAVGSYDKKWGVFFPIIGFRCKPVRQYWLSSYTGTTATVSWSVEEPGSIFDVRVVGEDGSDTTYVASGNALVLQNLSDSVHYNVMLRKQCHYCTSNYDTIARSGWLSYLSFGTTILPDTTSIDTVVVLPGDTLIVGGDTIVNTGDTIVVIPGEPVIIGGDTLVVNPGDSVVVNPGTPAVGFVQPDFVYRYTSVQPNPAADRVKVVSSFGLTRIEVYDTRGRLLHDLPASGLKATLDVSSWPRGTYLLRITTPVGQTTKKLLVQ